MLLPGLGQVYNGQISKAIIIWIAAAVCLLLTLVGGVGIFFSIIVWLCAIADAYSSAEKHNVRDVRTVRTVSTVENTDGSITTTTVETSDA
ncbi:MAG: hypothetical protein ACLPY5_05475 [Candidatus Bathyarchaeia archaeon]